MKSIQFGDFVSFTIHESRISEIRWKERKREKKKQKKLSEMTLICRGFTIRTLSERSEIKRKMHETEVNSFVSFIFIMESEEKERCEEKRRRKHRTPSNTMYSVVKQFEQKSNTAQAQCLIARSRTHARRRGVEAAEREIICSINSNSADCKGSTSYKCYGLAVPQHSERTAIHLYERQDCARLSVIRFIFFRFVSFFFHFFSTLLSSFRVLGHTRARVCVSLTYI